VSCTQPAQLNDSSEIVESHGAWPFKTRRVRRTMEGEIVLWESRLQRKGLLRKGWQIEKRVGWHLLREFWPPSGLNRWIGLIFAAGSSLFVIASLLSLLPIGNMPTQLANGIYFAGSIPFTIAAYLQLYQAANASAGDRVHWFGWKPADAGWLSCALQFLGTILFNVNTFDAMLPSLSWFQADLLIWIPNMAGSVLFLASGYLAFIEVCHAYWRWKPRSLPWSIVFINLLGCIGFMISACLAFTLPTEADPDRLTWSVLFTLQGAFCFLLGALLMLPEAVVEEEQTEQESQPGSPAEDNSRC